MGAFIVFGEKTPEMNSGVSRTALRYMRGVSEFGLAVEEDAADVIGMLDGGGMARLTRASGGTGRTVWVNPAAVLYVEEHDEAMSGRTADELPPDEE